MSASRGDRLVAAILAEMAGEGCVPTAQESELLAVARELADRLDRLEAALGTDGELLTSSTGVQKVHPAAVEHRQASMALARVLGGVVVTDSSAGKRPVKQRAAAARWTARDRQRDADVRRYDGGA
jgi:hypothetical protein